jgi:hypothetical protein
MQQDVMPHQIDSYAVRYSLYVLDDSPLLAMFGRFLKLLLMEDY